MIPASKNIYPSLKSQLLIAMPQMNDPRFHRAVIFMVAHDEKGSMGLVINDLLPSPNFPEVLEQLGISEMKVKRQQIANVSVLAGGPVEPMHGFLLHSADFLQKDTIRIDDYFSLSGTIESLKIIADGQVPENMLFTLGYAGWEAGQLEKELMESVWINIPATPDLVFATKAADMWEKSLSMIGANPSMLSHMSGNA